MKKEIKKRILLFLRNVAIRFAFAYVIIDLCFTFDSYLGKFLSAVPLVGIAELLLGDKLTSDTKLFKSDRANRWYATIEWTLERLIGAFLALALVFLTMYLNE